MRTPKAKNIFLAVLILLLTPVTLFFVLIAVINFVDWNKHKDFLQSKIAAYTDYRLEDVAGIKVRVWDTAELGVDRLVLKHAGEQSTFKSFTSDRAYVKIHLFPLLRDQLIVESVLLDKGRLALGPAVGAPADEPAAEEDGGLQGLPSIFARLVAINDTNIDYRAERGTNKLVLKHLGLTSPSDAEPAVLSGEGSVAGLPFELQGEFGSFNVFRDEGKPYPAKVEADIADQKLDAKGELYFARGATDFDIKLSAGSLEKIKKAFKIDLGPLPAYKLSVRLLTEPSLIKARDLELTLGSSSVQGWLELNTKGSVPDFKADLRAPRIVHADLSGFFKADSELEKPEDVPKAPGQYFSDKPIDTSALHTFNTNVHLLVDKFEGEKAGKAIDGGEATLSIQKGLAKLDPLVFRVAKGQVQGRFVFNAQKSPLKASIVLGAKRVDLQSLMAPTAEELPVLKVKPEDLAKGLLTGHLDLRMQGDTPMQLAKATQGDIGLAVEDGQLSKTIVEALGIDITQTIGNYFAGNDLTNMRCGLATFEAKSGRIDTKTFVIATRNDTIRGKGFVDLPGNTVNIEIATQPHDFSIGSARTPLYVRGALNDIEAGLQKKDLILRGAAAVALGVVNPVLAILPFVDSGLTKDGGCRQYMAELAELDKKAQSGARGKSVVR